MADMQKVFQLERQYDERKTIFLLGFCFALIAIGFSLFVMGIEGIADMTGSARELGSVSLKVTSPGIFCILLASFLVALSINGGWSAPSVTETKADVVRAEAQGKESIAKAEGDAKEQVIRAEAEVRERVIEAETRAKKELIEAEVEAKTRVPVNIQSLRSK
jgi:hypothetical protein